MVPQFRSIYTDGSGNCQSTALESGMEDEVEIYVSRWNCESIGGLCLITFPFYFHHSPRFGIVSHPSD
jgi:hypothetical protein